MVSPSTYATRIRKYGPSFGAVCFDQHSDEKPKVEMRTKSNCAPDGSVMLANGFSEWNCNNNLMFVYLTYIWLVTTFISLFISSFAMMGCFIQ